MACRTSHVAWQVGGSGFGGIPYHTATDHPNNPTTSSAWLHLRSFVRFSVIENGTISI